MEVSDSLLLFPSTPQRLLSALRFLNLSHNQVQDCEGFLMVSVGRLLGPAPLGPLIVLLSPSLLDLGLPPPCSWPPPPRRWGCLLEAVLFGNSGSSRRQASIQIAAPNPCVIWAKLASEHLRLSSRSPRRTCFCRVTVVVKVVGCCSAQRVAQNRYLRDGGEEPSPTSHSQRPMESDTS